MVTNNTEYGVPKGNWYHIRTERELSRLLLKVFMTVLRPKTAQKQESMVFNEPVGLTKPPLTLCCVFVVCLQQNLLAVFSIPADILSLFANSIEKPANAAILKRPWQIKTNACSASGTSSIFSFLQLFIEEDIC